MKNLKRLTKTFAVHAMIFSLLQTSFVMNSAFADNNTTEKTGKEILSVAQTAVGIYGQFLGQKQQSIMLQIQAQKNQQLMQSLSPGCRKADGTACFTVAGKFFPECPLPASMTNMPQNVCSSAAPDANQIAQMITYESISKSWINYFDQMMNEASNAQTPFGLKCLSDKQKALDSQLTEMVNNLTRLQDQLSKDKETFRANNKKILDELTTANDELMGASGTGKNNLKLKAQDFSKYFSASCQSVLGEEGLRDAPGMGLLGVMQSLSPANKRASDYSANRAMIESEVRNDITKIQNAIQNGGLQDYFDGKIAETSKFQSLIAATQKQSKEFSIAKERIANELKKIGYTLPTMDKNFSVDFGEFLNDSQTFFKKQYVNECVTGADKSGIAISSEQILNSLQQKSTGNAGTARDKYKAALKNILDSDSFIEDKLAQIKALEETYKDISITYQSSNGQRITETPYDLYMRTLSKCEERYKQDDQYANGSSGVSQKKKVERGQALLRELQSLHNNYSANLGTRVLEQVLSCNGEGKKAGSGCGNKDAFDYTSASFCMATANQCATEVNGCYAEAAKHVETRKTKMEGLAKAFNANAEILVARSNQLYNQQKAAVMDMIKVVQARFPGTNFPIPEGMFIAMPELKKDSFGVDLANDGNLSFMDDLPKKIELLKKVFKDQQSTVNKEIDDYIDKQTMAMGREKDRWQQLANECKGMIDRSSQELAKMNNENAKKQGELDSKVSSFCRKYSQLQDNPMGACEDAKDLAEAADKISSRLTSNAEQVTGQFRLACNKYMSEDTSSDGNLSRCLNDSDFKSKNWDICEGIIAKEKKKLSAKDASKEEGTGKKSKKKGDAPLSLNAICKNSKGEKASNKEMVENALSLLLSSEKDKFANNRKKNALVDGVESGNVSEVSGYDELEDNDFFSSLAQVATGDDICGELMKKDAGTVDPEAKRVADKNLKDAQTALEEANKKTPADAEAVKVANQKISEAEAAIKALTPAGKAQVTDLLALLKDAGTPAVLTPDQKKQVVFNRLGEQIDGSCDVQASNISTPKNWGSSFLNSFDQAILGTTK